MPRTKYLKWKRKSNIYTYCYPHIRLQIDPSITRWYKFTKCEYKRSVNYKQHDLYLSQLVFIYLTAVSTSIKYFLKEYVFLQRNETERKQPNYHINVNTLSPIYLSLFTSEISASYTKPLYATVIINTLISFWEHFFRFIILPLRSNLVLYAHPK